LKSVDVIIVLHYHTLLLLMMVSIHGHLVTHSVENVSTQLTSVINICTLNYMHSFYIILLTFVLYHTVNCRMFVHFVIPLHLHFFCSVRVNTFYFLWNTQ